MGEVRVFGNCERPKGCRLWCVKALPPRIRNIWPVLFALCPRLRREVFGS